jgi:hypothetical protein
MANTTFDNIHDLALISIKDWRLDALYTANPTNFNTAMDGYLVKSISFFTNCKQDLTNYTYASRTFNIVLTLTEQTILSNLEVIMWMDSQILDVRQMSLFLSDTDFKTFSQAQNLKAKIDAQNMLREKVNQDMTNYELKSIDWDAWAAGTYD